MVGVALSPFTATAIALGTVVATGSLLSLPTGVPSPRRWWVLGAVAAGAAAGLGIVPLRGVALVAGIALAIGHSVWEPNWRGVITLFGYGAILKGIARIGFPELPRKALASMLKSRLRWIVVAVVLLLGAWLTWEGFRG